MHFIRIMRTLDCSNYTARYHLFNNISFDLRAPSQISLIQIQYSTEFPIYNFSTLVPQEVFGNNFTSHQYQIFRTHQQKNKNITE